MQFIFPIRVYIEDTDYAGVVYHANYLNYFERARSEWIDQLGYGLDWQKEQQLIFPVRHLEIEYLKPARLNQKLEVLTRVESTRPASIIFDQQLRLAGTKDTILTTAKIKIACVDTAMRPQAVPQALLATLIGEPA